MERKITIISALFLFAILVTIGIVSLLPKDRLTFEEKLQIIELTKTLNSDLPRHIGSIGTLDSITFNNRSICYYMSVFGDSSIAGFYRSHYKEFRDVSLYSFFAMDGQNGNATVLAEYLNSKKISTKETISFPNEESVTWEYSSSDFLNFIQSYNGTPTEALSSVLDFQVDLANYGLSNITVESISELSEKGIEFISFEHMNDNIICHYDVDDNLYDLNKLSANAQLNEWIEFFVKDIATDSDVQELINMISISHSNFILRLRGSSSNPYFDFVIPYELIKRYSKVPNLH